MEYILPEVKMNEKIEKGLQWIFPLIVLALLIISINIHSTNNEKEYNPNVPVVYNGSNFLTKPQIKIVRIALTASPQTIDISGTGFTNVYAVIPQGENNTTNVGAMPNCSLKSFTSTSAIVNTTVANTILGLNLLGLTTPTVYTGMYVDLIIIGN